VSDGQTVIIGRLRVVSVPFLDVAAAQSELANELADAYARVAASGRYVLGDEVESFEREFADYCGTAECVGVSNGLDALSLSLEAHGIGSGDEVIVPAHTFIATFLAVSHVGAVPVPVEPDEQTYTISPLRLAAAITGRTRAVIPVHLYGHPADMSTIMSVTADAGLAVIEDCAQAHGARYRGRRAGSLATAAAFSFYPSKNLGALGDAGALTTDDAELAQRLRVLRNYGSPTRFRTEVRGHNMRLDPLQAAFLRVKLKLLDEWNCRRSRVADAYLDGLRGTLGLRLPTIGDGAEPAWHLFVVLHEERDRLQAELHARGVMTLVHYPIPPHRTEAYADLELLPGSLPITERICAQALSLPIGPHLSDSQVERVVEATIDAAAAIS
jgi:dTDP-3-amino-3,4,6-trideoxy-alpha-D-glucose transaminase